MNRQSRRKIAVPFILPALVVYSLFFVYPAVRALWVSLFDWTGFGSHMTYIGLGNYQEMLHDSIFWDSMKRTLVITVVGGIGIFALALFFSALLHRDIRGKKFFRALLFFPMVIPGVGIGLIWQFIFNNSWGPLSGFLSLVNLSRFDQVWLGPDRIVESLTAAIIWTFVGYYVVILVAGIDKIPPTYFEAAILDGASEWRMFFTIVLPMIWDVLVVAIILWVVGSLKIFDIIAATTFPDPPTYSYTMTIYIWSEAVGTYTPTYRLGYATALGVALLIMVVISVAVIRLVTRREAIEY